ncbi:MAG: 30S ribosomal protein S6 [Deltaproteobacteria bacterium]|nr:30S ribosomal protein S6 [Deltaproteobacteria bacterium]
MRHYETLFIVNPDLSEEDHAQTVERYQDILTSQGATPLLLTDDWGRRRLAYEINGFSKGNYVLFEHTASSEVITEMERNMRLDDKVLRFLTVKKADEFDEEAFQARQPKAASPEETKAEKAEVSEAKAEVSEAKAEVSEAEAEGSEAKAEVGEVEAEAGEVEEPKEEEAETQAQGEVAEKDKKETPPAAAEPEGEAGQLEAEDGQESDSAADPAEKTES